MYEQDCSFEGLYFGTSRRKEVAFLHPPMMDFLLRIIHHCLHNRLLFHERNNKETFKEMNEGKKEGDISSLPAEFTIYIQAFPPSPFCSGNH